ncbi:tetratricopeptide repeat protein [bacterium]|nr:tetratricopeptide repeat protein [bacterium]
MRKKILGFVCLIILSSALTQNIVSASTQMFEQYYNAGQNYLTQGQYSSAIVEFRKALGINYLDNSARIGLINAYLARATYYANQEKNYDKSANDFRSALFYLKIFPNEEQAVQNSSTMITSANENLNQCLKVIGFDKTASSRYKKAEELRAIGNFSAAAFEFSKAAQNESYAGRANAQIGDLLKVLRNEPRCADYYKIALDLMPNDSMLRMKYARTLDKLGRYDEAVVHYNSALATSKGDMEVLYALERIYMKKLAQTPSDAELHANIGAIKQAQGDFDSALSYYSKAEQINPSNVNTRLNVGTLFQQQKDYLKALKSYESVLALYPDNTQANLYKAQVLSLMGNKKEAFRLYQKVLSLDPTNAVAKSEIVGVMQDTMSPREFVAYLTEKAKNDKSASSMLYDYAYKLHKDNKIDDAINAYNAVLSSNTSNTDAYVNLAICYASKNDYKNAEKVLNVAKTKFPTNNLVLKTLQDVQKDSLSTALASASRSYENKDFKTAHQQYLSIKPATEESLLGVAASYQSMEDFDNAIDYYKKAMSISPKNSEIPYYIGYLYSEQQKWQLAEEFLKKSLVLNPASEAKNLLPYVTQNFTLAEYNEAVNLYEKNLFESALTKFNEVLKKETNNAFAYYYRGLIYDEQKKYKLAIEDYNKFTSIYTTDDEYLRYIKARVEELKPYAS